MSDLPLEYLDGYVVFLGRKFLVDPRALIPRLETETLVRRARDILQRDTDIKTLIDVGTGTGIIGISLVREIVRPLRCYLIDISADTLNLAQQNVAALCGEEHYDTHHGCLHRRTEDYRNTCITLRGDLLSPIIRTGNMHNIGTSCLITANLPYLRTADIHGELLHEPKRALDGGNITGFELFERFFEQIKTWKIRPETCHVLIEFGLWQRDIAETYFQKNQLTYAFFSDLRGIERFAHVVT
jgi:release factor glutamine methyltransferase